MARIRWLQAALENLDTQTEYTAHDNPKAALRFVVSIIEAVQRLQQHPGMGRPGRVSGVRELVVPGTPYIVVPYRVRAGNIEILRVFHAARTWPKTF